MTTTKRCGSNKLKMPKEPLYILVNGDGQPDNEDARKLSSFIGVLARDPRMMPIYCFDFKKIGEDRIKRIRCIVSVPNASFRGNLCELYLLSVAS